MVMDDVEPAVWKFRSEGALEEIFSPFLAPYRNFLPLQYFTHVKYCVDALCRHVVMLNDILDDFRIPYQKGEISP